MIMTLWHLMEALCVSMPVGASLAAARVAKTGFAGYVLCVLVGLTVGTCCGWAMYSSGKLMYLRIRQRSESVRERYFRLLYVGAMIWIVGSGFIGFWASRGILRLVL